MTGDQIAAAAAAVLAPYLPRLLNIGKEAVASATETAISEGREIAWDAAQKIWAKITDRFGKDEKLRKKAELVAVDPADDSLKQILADELKGRLKEDPDLAAQIQDLLGGDDSVQQIIATEGSWVENVIQEIEGDGRQTVEATQDSIISGVRQSKK